MVIDTTSDNTPLDSSDVSIISLKAALALFIKLSFIRICRNFDFTNYLGIIWLLIPKLNKYNVFFSVFIIKYYLNN